MLDPRPAAPLRAVAVAVPDVAAPAASDVRAHAGGGIGDPVPSPSGAHSSGRGTNPVLGLVRTTALLLRRELKFCREDVDSVLETDDGRRYRVFRHVVIEGRRPPPEALLIVRFTPAHMSIRANIRFSRLPLLVFPGFRGFRSKYWCVDGATGACEGVYEWQSRADAEAYAGSIAMRFMTNRSLPGSVSCTIVERAGDAGWPFMVRHLAEARRTESD